MNVALCSIYNNFGGSKGFKAYFRRALLLDPESSG
jgi:hypothetical protein